MCLVNVGSRTGVLYGNITELLETYDLEQGYQLVGFILRVAQILEHIWGIRGILTIPSESRIIILEFFLCNSNK